MSVTRSGATFKPSADSGEGTVAQQGEGEDTMAQLLQALLADRLLRESWPRNVKNGRRRKHAKKRSAGRRPGVEKKSAGKRPGVEKRLLRTEMRRCEWSFTVEETMREQLDMLKELVAGIQE